MSAWLPVLEDNQGTLSLAAIVIASGLALWQQYLLGSSERRRRRDEVAFALVEIAEIQRRVKNITPEAKPERVQAIRRWLSVRAEWAKSQASKVTSAETSAALFDLAYNIESWLLDEEHPTQDDVEQLNFRLLNATSAISDNQTRDRLRRGWGAKIAKKHNPA